MRHLSDGYVGKILLQEGIGRAFRHGGYNRGKDERHIDKAVWQLPIPEFDSADPTHARLAELGAAEAVRVAALGLDESKNFVKLRQVVRSVLADSPDAEELDQLVRLLLE